MKRVVKKAKVIKSKSVATKVKVFEIEVPEERVWFRCASSPNYEYVTNEMCAARKTNPVMIAFNPDCKKCAGRNRRIVKKARRKYTKKIKKT